MNAYKENASILNQGTVFDFHRGTTHDGPGMRTTVFLKGCPLHCRWCHNPESICPAPQILWDRKKCIGCRTCIESCPEHAVIDQGHGLVIDPALCKDCRRCTDDCPTGAMHVVGQRWEVPALVKQACRDKMFFGDFEGGVTVSGGEPAFQPAFLLEFVKGLKAEGVSVALDTCGFAVRDVYEKLLPFVDIFLYDIKLMDPQLHREYTGVSNDRILDNLLFLAEEIRKNRRNRLWIRTPLIPGATATEENIRAVGSFLRDCLPDIPERWELCAFNNVCREKYQKLHLDWQYREEPLMDGDEVERLGEIARSYVGDRLVMSGLTRKKQ